MFLRYADVNNLSVAVPYSGVYLDAAATGHSIRVKELKESPFAPPSGKYHLLVHHTRLNVRSMQQVRTLKGREEGCPWWGGNKSRWEDVANSAEDGSERGERCC